MTHESVWYSRPRKYGKGSRQWCVQSYLSAIPVAGICDLGSGDCDEKKKKWRWY
ncbi:hypothetical protein BJX64DRAFT_260889 [Aspergillus heterothallicus]